jgi:hypothetical protein
MKARLSSSELPMLASLTTRDSNDAAIALLDAWATIGDVLTFYQERIANEGYLGTATERRSILELARLVGYRLRPGLSASVYLAYALEPTQESTVIEAGNKAQSLPGPNEKPQVFETTYQLIAYAGLNLLKPRLTQPQLFKLDGQEVINPEIALLGLTTNLRINDSLLLDLSTIGERPTITSTNFYRATAITPEPGLNRTLVKLELQDTAALPGAPAKPTPPEIFIDAVAEIVKKYIDLAAFELSEKSKIVSRVKEKISKLLPPTSGSNDDKARVLKEKVESLLAEVTDEYAFASSRGYDKIASWLAEIESALKDLTSSEIKHDNPDRQPALGVPDFVDLFQPFKQPPSLQPLTEAQLSRRVGQIFNRRSEFVAQLFGTINPQAAPFVKDVLSNAGPVNIPTPSKRTVGMVQLTGVQALRQKATLAGHSFPTIFTQAQVSNATVTTPLSPPGHREYVQALRQAGKLDGDPAASGLLNLALDAEYDQIKTGDKIAIVRPAVSSARTSSTHTVLSAEPAQLTFAAATLTVTVLKLTPEWLTAAEHTAALSSNLLVRNARVHLQAETLQHVEMPITSDIGSTTGAPPPLIELSELYSNLQPGGWAIISGERVVSDPHTDLPVNTGVQVSELLMLASVAHEAKTLVDGEPTEVKGEKLHTFIRPDQLPAFTYKRDTVKIYGNVVHATHGETRNEVLGSGDGSQVLQKFQLRQPPLTYLAAPNPAGVESTLEVRVNDIRWHEADNLFTLGPDDRKYITKTDDDARTTVIYGDGKQGARLPTGTENIKAVYRSGLGSGGNVKAAQISLPLTKPLGVKSVINPLPASGGVDKETRDQARRNAPLAVLALDRLVSVQDYADFARTFAGIAKASAQRLSDGVREVVHLTIAGAGNIVIDPTSDLYRNLVAALARFGDPLQPVVVESFERVLLVVSAKINLLPDYLWESVKGKLRALLWEQLGFENRELGQDVTLSEVLSLMQSVPGVNYVDFELLDSVNEEKLKDPNLGVNFKLKPRVNAALARTKAQPTVILPAQLVFLSQDAADTLILEEVAE